MFGLEHVVMGAAVELLGGVDEVPTLCCEVLAGVFSDLAEVLYHFYYSFCRVRIKIIQFNNS